MDFSPVQIAPAGYGNNRIDTCIQVDDNLEHDAVRCKICQDRGKVHFQIIFLRIGHNFHTERVFHLIGKPEHIGFGSIFPLFLYKIKDQTGIGRLGWLVYIFREMITPLSKASIPETVWAGASPLIVTLNMIFCTIGERTNSR